MNNCGFRRISSILNIPLATCFMWIKKAGVIVDRAVRETRFKAGEEVKDDIEVLEMDELYTYIKKNLQQFPEKILMA